MKLKLLKKRNGISIRVNRLLSEGNRPYVELHQSERSLDNSEFDYVIDNNSDIPHLIEEVRKMLIHFKII